MQKLKCIYQNKIIVECSESGWCLLKKDCAEVKTLWSENCCLVFFPKGFVPDAVFGEKLERFGQKQAARLMWIENPADAEAFWRLTTVSFGSLTVYMGRYRIHLGECVRETDDMLFFSGSFYAGKTTFDVLGKEIALCLADCLGRISFRFNAGPDNFSDLDVGMKYLRLLPEETENGWKTNYSQCVDSAVITPESEIIIEASVSPASLSDRGCSKFVLPKARWRSAFLSVSGESVPMESQEAVLCFEKTAQAVCTDRAKGSCHAIGISWYLGINGEFCVSGEAAVMPGLSGTEYVSPVKRIWFAAGERALIVAEEHGHSTQEPPFPVTAPWIRFEGEYHCNSLTTPFFVAEGDYLRLYAAKIGAYAASPSFPAIPWGGVRNMTGSVDVPEMEKSFYENRYDILTRGMDAYKDWEKQEKVLVAPCGLCVGVQPESGCFHWVGIARLNGSGLPDVRMEMPSFAVRAAIQRLDCILMASERDEFLALGEKEIQFKFMIEGWALSFSKDTWGENSLFLLKYSQNCTVRALLEHTRQLSYILEIAYDSQGELRAGFDRFIDLLDKKEFQGILLLGGEVQINELPYELRRILKWGGGGAPEVIYAVITGGKVSVDRGEVAVAESGIDALVLYEDVPVFGTDGSPFSFCTRELTVIIKDSSVKYFRSRSELSVYSLFGARLSAKGSLSGNQMILTGRMENINGVPVYRFALDAPFVYSVLNSPLAELEIQGISISGGDEKIVFHLRGAQTYRCMEELDLFSYEKIGFEGVCLEKDSISASVNYDACRLITENAAIRENSFAAIFGAIPDVSCWDMQGLPDERGYIAINTPIAQGKLTQPWNGIVWRIPLNGSGALGDNGMLNICLMAGWNGTDYYIGVKTGGIFGQSFSLQGILTAGFTGITLEKGGAGRLLFVLHSFALKAIGFSLPKHGMDVCILGENGKAAWYAAYEEEADNEL